MLNNANQFISRNTNHMINYRILHILFVVFILSAGCTGFEGQYDIRTINEDPNSDTSHPINVNACISLDLNFDENDDIQVCKNKVLTLGGLSVDRSFLVNLNDDLKIAATMTMDSTHVCCVEQNDMSFPLFCDHRMSKAELNCPDIGQYSVEPFPDQMYPTIFEDNSEIVDADNFMNNVTLLSYSNTTRDPSQDNTLHRTYWRETDKNYLFFEIPRNGTVKRGWIQLSETFIHEIAIEKD